jgi:hypothetical protein
MFGDTSKVYRHILMFGDEFIATFTCLFACQRHYRSTQQACTILLQVCPIFNSAIVLEVYAYSAQLHKSRGKRLSDLKRSVADQKRGLMLQRRGAYNAWQAVGLPVAQIPGT